MTVSAMAHVVAFLSDLLFETKIRSTGDAVGAHVRIVRTLAELQREIQTAAPSLLIVDANHPSGDAVAAIAAGRAAPGPPRLIAFVSHVDQGNAQAAQEAGADLVLPRSRFVHMLPELLRQAAAPPKREADGC